MMKTMKVRSAALLLAVIYAGCSMQKPEEKCYTLDQHADWLSGTGSSSNIAIVKEEKLGGNRDLMGNGALCLAKESGDFHASSAFMRAGEWTSDWVRPGEEVSLDSLTISLLCYGKKQDMRSGWTKFEGNPLVCQAGWHHATGQTLTLPDSLPGQPADPALFRGKGNWEGKWLLFFDIGCWAVNGWGMAVADSLTPLKRGINPFTVARPYPLAIGKSNDTIYAPTDFYYQDGTWLTTCESGKVIDTIPEGFSVGLETMQIRYRVINPALWISHDLKNWTNSGMLKGVTGNDPGITYNGHFYYIFCEDGESLTCFTAEDPLETWATGGTALDVGDHTGDPDVTFMNNRWHLFFDDAPHFHYQIGYASTSLEDFPYGWEMENKIFGPHHPEQGQAWDDDLPEGNNFGTGDADVALEGHTLYMTYEWPVGIAWKELDVLSAEEMEVTLVLEIDQDGDDLPDQFEHIRLHPGMCRVYATGKITCRRYRIRIEMMSDNPEISPMITALSMHYHR
jgi:hypothetical protein